MTESEAAAIRRALDEFKTEMSGVLRDFAKEMGGLQVAVTHTATQREEAQEAHKDCRAQFEKRVSGLERFRWQIGGALVLLSVGVPVLLHFV